MRTVRVFQMEYHYNLSSVQFFHPTEETTAGKTASLRRTQASWCVSMSCVCRSGEYGHLKHDGIREVQNAAREVQ
jgi:hypothetical protein